MKKSLFIIVTAMILFAGWAYVQFNKQRARICKLIMRKRLSQQ